MHAWKCPTCGEGPSTLLGKRGGKTQREQLGVETNIFRCDTCGLLFPNPFPIPLDAQKLYGDPVTYFSGHDLDAKVVSYRKLYQGLKARMRSNECSLLDIGSGRGDMLQAAKLEGCTDFVGLEFSSAMRNFAKANFDIALSEKTAEVLAVERPASFDIVVLNAVLEHVYQPNELIESVAKLCKPNAILYIDVPCEPHLLTLVGNTLNRLRRNNIVLNLQPTWSPFHVYGFNPRALTVLLNKNGFDVENLKIHASPDMPGGGTLKNRIQSQVATQINRLANAVNYASNMYVFARKT